MSQRLSERPSWCAKNYVRFRAQSDECIEFRHTNEVPKELELDDFQVKTPTDTIGQHIHLVKFDVTASFALLYDPRDRSSEDEFDRNVLGEIAADGDGSYAVSGNQGMKRLVCEARWRLSPWWLDKAYGNGPLTDPEDGSWFFEGDVPPAWVAGGRHRDDRHKGLSQGDLLASRAGESEVQALRDHAIHYRE